MYIREVCTRVSRTFAIVPTAVRKSKQPNGQGIFPLVSPLASGITCNPAVLDPILVVCRLAKNIRENTLEGAIPDI